jgi:hypothetical protein
MGGLQHERHLPGIAEHEARLYGKEEEHELRCWFYATRGRGAAEGSVRRANRPWRGGGLADRLDSGKHTCSCSGMLGCCWSLSPLTRGASRKSRHQVMDW